MAILCKGCAEKGIEKELKSEREIAAGYCEECLKELAKERPKVKRGILDKIFRKKPEPLSTSPYLVSGERLLKIEEEEMKREIAERKYAMEQIAKQERREREAARAEASRMDRELLEAEKRRAEEAGALAREMQRRREARLRRKFICWDCPLDAMGNPTMVFGTKDELKRHYEQVHKSIWKEPFVKERELEERAVRMGKRAAYEVGQLERKAEEAAMKTMEGIEKAKGKVEEKVPVIAEKVGYGLTGGWLPKVTRRISRIGRKKLEYPEMPSEEFWEAKRMAPQDYAKWLDREYKKEKAERPPPERPTERLEEARKIRERLKYLDEEKRRLMDSIRQLEREKAEAERIAVTPEERDKVRKYKEELGGLYDILKTQIEPQRKYLRENLKRISLPPPPPGEGRLEEEGRREEERPPGGRKCSICGKYFATREEFLWHKEAGECKPEEKSVKELTAEQIKEKLGGWKTEVKAAPGKALAEAMEDYLGTFGRGFKTRIGVVTRPFLKNAFLFAIYFPIAIWSITSLAAPILEGWFGMPLIPTWFVSLLNRSFWIVMAAMFGIILPPSLVLGKAGLDFDYINKGLLAVIAISASMWGANTFFIPAVKAFMPQEYAMMMCLIKYSGNMQICVVNQTQQVQVQKIGSYQVLTLEMGIVTPSRKIPPMNPNPAQLPYYFTFTLKNTNEVGSPFEINVSCDHPCETLTDKEAGIKVVASQSGGKESKTAIDYPYFPRYPIKSGGYVIVQAKFDGTPNDPNDPHNLPRCPSDGSEPYTYFHINITTDQSGGGSAKYGIIESDEGIDNQNFMFFFDPDVKTQPGPVDIYTYTIPFVLPAKRVSSEPFMTFIPIENKGSGIIEEIKVSLIYDSNILTIRPNFNSYCTGKICNVKFPSIEQSTDENGLTKITFQNQGGSINAGETYVIYNTEGNLTNPDVIGKSTGLISAVATYRYKQKFDEQIACIQVQSSEQQSLCAAKQNEDECKSTQGCKWCGCRIIVLISGVETSRTCDSSISKDDCKGLECDGTTCYEYEWVGCEAS